MSNASSRHQQWTERSSANEGNFGDLEPMFRLLFERSADAIFLLDPRQQVFVDCNQAAVELLRATDKKQLLLAHPADLSPPFQPDGRNSREKTPEMMEIALARGSHRFEWLARCFDGTELPVEVSITAIQSGANPLLATICRDITERKAAEAGLLQSNASLERRVGERTAELLSTNEQLRSEIAERQRQEKIQRALFQISEAVHTAHDLDSFYEQVHAIVRSLMRAENFYIALRDTATETVSFAYWANELGEAPPQTRPTAIGRTGEVLLTGEPLLETRPPSPGEAGTESRGDECRRQTTTWLGAPLILQGCVFGVMAVGDYHETSAYTENEKQILTFIAEQTALAVMWKRAERDLRRRSELVQKHRDVLLDLAQLQKPDFQPALKKICACAAAALDTARVSYWSLVDNRSAIVCKLLHLRDQPAAPDTTRGARLGLSDCPAYFDALATRRPIVANRALDHPATRGLADNYLKPLGISAMLDAPVWVRGEVVGVLCHEHIGPARDWSAEEIDFVSALAAMVSLALEESDRARSERRLRESEEKFRALFEATSQGVLLHDENKFMEINPAGVRIMGFDSADEIIGKHPGETSAPIQPNGEPADTLARKYIQECMTRGNARFDWVTRSPRGVEVPIEVVLTRITLGDRQLIQAVFNDITERKRAETALRESEQRLRESEARFSTAFHASPVLITISTLNDARFIEANEAFMQWIGLPRDNIVGRTSQDLDMWLDQTDRLKFLKDLQQTRSIRNVECRLRSQRDTFHTMLLCADIIEINREPHMLVFGLDVTERKQAEAEMLKALEQEKELGQFKSNFVSMVSHEFRTPLGIIQSSAEILSDYFERLAAGERKEQLQSIVKNTRRMAEMMEEILALSRLDAGRMEFKPAPLDLAAFFRRTVDEVQSATNRRCAIELSLATLPETAYADQRLLGHIFTNLLNNAVKYSEPGARVEFAVEQNGPRAICRIHDRGIGIPARDQPWLFNPFQRGGNVGDRPGTGLGLVLVKRCVELHGGDVRIESDVGRGTTVTVRLPIC